jgi:hypothetical protein
MLAAPMARLQQKTQAAVTTGLAGTTGIPIGGGRSINVTLSGIVLVLLGCRRIAHFRFRRHSGPCPDFSLARSVENDPTRMFAELRLGFVPIHCRVLSAFGTLAELVRSAAMLRVQDMLARAEQCEMLANKTNDLPTVYALQEAAQHWRMMAVQADLLEREPSYRMLRARTEE